MGDSKAFGISEIMTMNTHGWEKDLHNDNNTGGAQNEGNPIEDNEEAYGKSAIGVAKPKSSSPKCEERP